jgi:hypothetical protein
MERAHRRFSPSQADRNALCPGSSALLARVPKAPSSPYAKEGTDAHAVLQAGLENGVRDAVVAHREYSYLFDVDLDDGTNEFYLAVQAALDYAYDLMDEYPNAQVWIEHEVAVESLNAPGEADGFVDFAMYIPDAQKVIVMDYKHGAGIAKEPDCRQLKQYAAGLVYGTLAEVVDIQSVTLVIVQPRAFHKNGGIREAQMTPYDLYEYCVELDHVILQAIAPDAPLIPGTEQCRFCDAVPYCPAREAHALSVANTSFQQIHDLRRAGLPSVNALDFERLGFIRAHAPALRDWLKQVEERCYHLAREGHYVPGAKLVEAVPQRRYFAEERETAHKLAALLGEPKLTEAVKELYEFFDRTPTLMKLFRPHLMPLTTAEKTVVEAFKTRAARGMKKKAAEDAKHSFAFLTIKESSGTLSLVDESDERPAVNARTNAFAQIEATALSVPTPPLSDRS